MRIYGSNGATLGSAASTARRGQGERFTLPETKPMPDARSAQAPRAVGTIDVLLAMQAIDDPAERRRQSVKRGHTALDVLDDLKIGLLSGSLTPATMQRLRVAAANLKSTSGDPGLDGVLSEIELRVEVELAKAGQA